MTITQWLNSVVADPTLHARWLNTLSYLENCGARLIARCEHPTMVTREVLKHASEEFRHAYYLKSLIHRIAPDGLVDYSQKNLLGGFASYHYLARLNAGISRWLRDTRGASGKALKELAYLLVTYAIEVRAMEIYRPYEDALRSNDAPLSIKSILREEIEHLREIDEELEHITDADALRQGACELEGVLYERWWRSVA